MKRLLFLLAVLALSCFACSSTQQGDQPWMAGGPNVANGHIRLTFNPQATTSCKFLGNVSGSYTWVPQQNNDAQHAATFRRNAAKLGADLVLISTKDDDQGEAYRCGEQK
jgi:hypothetical protein